MHQAVIEHGSNSPAAPARADQQDDFNLSLADPDTLHRRLVEGVTDYAIYMLSPSGIVRSWNRGAQRLKGYTADEIIGQHFSRFYPAEDQAIDRPARALHISASTGRFEDKAWRVRKDGSRFRAHVIIDAIRGEQDELIGFAKITSDISRAYEQELALRESEQRFRLLVSGVTDYAIYMLDLNGQISSWNAGAERFKGYREEEVLGRHFSLFHSPQDIDRGMPANALARTLSEGRYEATGWRVRKDGSQFWAHVIIDLIRDESGQPIGYAKITRDISERRAADLRLAELTDNNRELERFIHIASHDLREPLRKVLMFSDLLIEEERGALSEAGEGYVRSIASATHRMQALLASLLNLNRVTSQGGSFDPCELNHAVSDACSDLQVKIQNSGARVHAGPLPQIEADMAQMRQLFQNLIENAIKYARPDVAPFIDISEVHSTQTALVVIRVQDNGMGFDNCFADRIFEVFQRLHTRDQIEGAGMGLSICKRICERHGGSITARGSDVGACFELRLPRAHQPDAGQPV